MKGLAQSHAEFYFPEFEPRARGLESRSSSPRAAQALAAGLRVAVSGPVALSAKLRDPAPCPGRLETARLAPSQPLRPRPPPVAHTSSLASASPPARAERPRCGQDSARHRDGSPGQGAGPGIRSMHAAHRGATHAVSGSKMSPQPGRCLWLGLRFHGPPASSHHFSWGRRVASCASLNPSGPSGVLVTQQADCTKRWPRFSGGSEADGNGGWQGGGWTCGQSVPSTGSAPSSRAHITPGSNDRGLSGFT